MPDPMFDDERDEEVAAMILVDSTEYVEHEGNDEDTIAEAVWNA